MKKESSENIVRVKGVPKMNEEQLAVLHKLAATPDRDIDTSISGNSGHGSPY